MNRFSKKVSVIGTVGVPANYGGFETLVENIIGDNCSDEIDYTIYCSRKNYSHKIKEYKRAKLKYVLLSANGAQSILYDIISIFRSVFNHSDVLLILGVSGCMVLPLVKLISSSKIIVNIDGLEHQRNKWNKIIRKFLKWSEKISVKCADIVVTDNKAIQDYVSITYNKPSSLIAYGGDHVQCDMTDMKLNILREYNLKSGEYGFSVCRIEPENNLHVILKAFAATGEEFVCVGNWNNSKYGKELLARYSSYVNIRMLSPTYELSVLNVLRSHCKFYLHGHSAGGTNPSLVEAMFFAKPILAFDVVYNRETTENKAFYFADTSQLIELLNRPYDQFLKSAEFMLRIAQKRYLWKTIAKQYEALY